jgi:very-short-patch-repair endonuclease
MYRLIDIRNYARKLRRNQTEAEEFLWEKLRNRKLAGYKFLRQHPIIYKQEGAGYRYFIADFYCHSKNVVIELDGKIHETTTEYDEFRDLEMKFLDIRVLRLKNEELENIDSALAKIKNLLEEFQQ